LDPGAFHHDRFDEAALDRPPRDAPPARRLVIASTARSGSYLLCRQLFRAGLGVPTEYLRAQTMRELAQRWALPPGDQAYLREVERRRTADNGVFATKLQPQHVHAHPVALDRWFARADLVVVLTRDDRLAQAASWLVSLATGYWSSDATRGPRMPGAEIDDVPFARRLAAQLERENRWIEATCSSLGRPTLTLAYETLVRDQPGAIAAIGGRLGLASGAWRATAPEPRPAGLPVEVEAARARLLAALRGSG
jgi:LPS sulfotransferase NodH